MEEDAVIQDSAHKTSLLTRFLSVATVVLAGILASATVLVWGGMPHDFAIWLFPLGALLWLLIVVAVIRNIRRKVLTGSWLEIVVMAWLAYAVFSHYRTPAEYPARFELLWIFTYAAVFIAVRNVVHNQKWYIGLLTLLIVAATVSCIYGLGNKGDAQYLIWDQPRPDYGERISGTFGCPNHFGNLMAMTGFAILGLCFYSRVNWPARIFFLYLFAMLTAGIYFSYSRGSYIGWIIGLFVTFLLASKDPQKPLRLKLVAFVVLILVLGGCVFAVMKNDFALSRIQATFNGDIRVLLAQDAIRIWLNNKLLGSGMATFDFVHQRIHPVNFGGRAVYTHDDYLNLLADYGLVGFVLVFAFMALLAWRLWHKQAQSDGTELEQVLARIGCTVLAIMAVHSFVDFNFHVPACALAFFILTACGGFHLRRKNARSFVGQIPNFALLGAGAASVVLMLYLTLKTSNGMGFFDQSDAGIMDLSVEDITTAADQLYDADRNATELLEKAGDAFRVKAANLNPSISQARNEKDQAGIESFIRERERIGLLALKYYALAADSNPLYDNLLIKQGMTLDILQRYDEAYLFYAKAIQNQPYNVFFKYHYGFHLVAVQEYDLARQQFEAALQVRALRDADKEIRTLAQKALQSLPKSGAPAP